LKQRDIRASFDDGVLKLTAPTAVEKAPSQRRIEIG